MGDGHAPRPTDYSAKPNELHLFAFHAFPEDLTIIKIQSIFELG